MLRYAGRHVACRKIDDATPRRALILGTAIWLAKQMNLIEFMAAADELFHQLQIELWVVGNVADQLQAPGTIFARPASWVSSRIWSRFFVASESVSSPNGPAAGSTLDYIFNRVPIATIRGGIAGLPLTPGLDYLSFASVRELAQGVVALIDDIQRLNSLQQAAYEKCKSGFDWSDRGRTLCSAIQKAVNRQRAAHARS
jgi:hypothetical protein